MYYLLFGQIEKTNFVRLLNQNLKIVSESQKEHGNFLKLADSMLKKRKISVKDVSGIFAVNDSGTFSGVRGAITVGNVLSYALKIPATPVSIKDINDKKRLKAALKNKSQILTPKYSKEPNITYSRPKTIDHLSIFNL